MGMKDTQLLPMESISVARIQGVPIRIKIVLESMQL